MPAPITTPRAAQRVVFATVTAALAIETMVFTLVLPAFPIFARTHNLSDAGASLIFAAFPIGQLVTAAAFASHADRFSRRTTLLVGTLLLVVATFAFSQADTIATFGIARTVQGVGAGFIWVGGIAAIADVFPDSERGYRIGLAEFAGGAIGLVGPVIGGPLIDAVGVSKAFIIASGVAALVTVGAAALPREADGDRLRSPVGLTSGLRAMASQPQAILGVVALSTGGVVLALLEPLMALDLERRLDASSTQIGLTFAAGLIAYVVATPLVGRYTDRRGRRGTILVGGVLVAAALPLCSIGPVWLVASGFLVVGAGLSAMVTPSGPLLMSAIDASGFRGCYGFSSALLTGVFAFGYAVGPLAGAAARTAVPFTAVVAALGCMVAVAVLVMGRLREASSP